MATGKVNSHGIPLNKRSGPGTGYPVVGSLADGTTVTIVCQADGTTESGDFGPTALWDRLEDGSYVSDAFVSTGTNNRVAPSCDPAPQPAPSPGGTIQQRLASFMATYQGKTLSKYDSVPGQCFSVANTWSVDYLKLHEFTCQYAAQIIDQGGSDYTRVDMAPGKVPPAGAIVVFHEYAPQEIGSAGHVDVCVSATAAGFTGFDQNWGSPRTCRQVTHDYAAVTGWLIPSHLG